MRHAFPVKLTELCGLNEIQQPDPFTVIYCSDKNKKKQKILFLLYDENHNNEMRRICAKNGKYYLTCKL